MEIRKGGTMALSTMAYIKNITERCEQLLETSLRSRKSSVIEEYYSE